MSDKIKMRAKFEGTCLSCETKFKAGSWIMWNPELKKVYHYRCIVHKSKKTKAKKKGNSLVAQRPARGSARHFIF